MSLHTYVSLSLPLNSTQLTTTIAEEMVAGRGGADHGPRTECIHRNRPIEESITEFKDMKEGKYRPGTATLRMKQDILGNGNPHMWDMVAYRTLDAPHHRTGTKWKIYPTYDYTHCLVDSFENISYAFDCPTSWNAANNFQDTRYAPPNSSSRANRTNGYAMLSKSTSPGSPSTVG